MHIDRKNLKQVVGYLVAKGYTLLGEGTSRIALRTPNGRFVLKLPKGDQGICDNYNEAAVGSRVNRGPHANPYRRALAHSRNALEVCLLMEYVEPQAWNKTMPGWVSGIDCQQVGYTKDGVLVAYDYA